MQKLSDSFKKTHLIITSLHYNSEIGLDDIPAGSIKLLGFFVQGVNLAAAAVFFHFNTIRVILFVFAGCIISLFALRTSNVYCYAHFTSSTCLFNS
jgi:hypothetical protein